MAEATRPWWDPKRPMGFRFCVTDAAVLVLAVAATWLLLILWGPMAWVLPIVLGHFFLFCNVVRAGRIAELLWAGAFLVNVTAFLLSGPLNWPAILLAQSPVTLAVILATVFRRDYRGLGHSLRRAQPPRDGIGNG